MVIVFRTDSSQEIGTGHVMRCLSFAEALRRNGASVFFICRDLYGNISSAICARGFEVYMLHRPGQLAKKALHVSGYQQWLGVDLMEDAIETTEQLQKFNSVNWLIVDHYAIDYYWENKLREKAKRIFVIDDLANRIHDADILLDQNLYPEMKRRYQGFVSSSTELLLGPKYALLRSEFFLEKKRYRSRDGHIKRIFIFYGGVDSSNETEKAIHALRVLQVPVEVDVVVGGANKRQERIRELCKASSNFTFYLNVNNIAELMANADLAIGAGGTTTWERCALGLPALITILAENQVEVVNSIVYAGAAISLGWYKDVTVDSIIDVFNKVAQSPGKVQRMSKCAHEIIGNNSGTEKISSILLGGSYDSN